MDKPKRVQILEKGAELTTGDRNKSYGSPFPNLTTFAKLVDAYLRGLGWYGPPLDAVDGSIIMNQAKVSRVAVNKFHDDNYLDGSVYFAIGGECADILKNQQTTPVHIGGIQEFIPLDAANAVVEPIPELDPMRKPKTEVPA